MGYSSIEGLDESVAERLVGEGFLSYDDLSVIEPEDLMEMGGLSEEAVDAIVTEAERRATIAEEAAADQRRRQREQEQLEATAAAVAVEAPSEEAAAPEADDAVPESSEDSEESQPEEPSAGEVPDAE
jgi:N utilization substance protein A